jgi:hypothetical protein
VSSASSAHRGGRCDSRLGLRSTHVPARKTPPPLTSQRGTSIGVPVTSVIKFRLTLGPPDWEQNTGGWRCAALRIPSAQVDTVWSAGTVIDSVQYQVDREQHLIRWAQANPPAEIAVGISVDNNLSTAEELEKKKLKWSAGASIIGALFGASATLIVGYWTSHKSSPEPVPTATLSATTFPSTSASSAPPSTLSAAPTARRCPNPPKPDVKVAVEPYVVEVAQAMSQDVPFYTVNRVAQEAADKLGDRWKASLATAPNEKSLRDIDETERMVFVGRWYGLSRGVAEGMCCYLEERGWTGVDASVLKHCIPAQQPVTPRVPKAGSSAGSPPSASASSAP